MRISRRTRYGVRLMIELAMHYRKAPLSINVIAENEQISSKFLGQIIIPLKGAGLLQSERGARGGYSLTKDPKEITVHEIYTILEGESAVVECSADEQPCERIGVCVARNLWEGLNNIIIDKLSSVTLDDLAKEAEAVQGSISPNYHI